jgi:hypothetical protein
MAVPRRCVVLLTLIDICKQITAFARRQGVPRPEGRRINAS